MKKLSTSLLYLMGFALFFVFSPVVLFGQEASGSNATGTDLPSIQLITTITALLSGLVAFIVAVFTTKQQVKKKVDEIVKAKAKTYVDEFFEKELHLDTASARAFFNQLKQEREQLAQRKVWVINHSDDKDKRSVFEQLHKNGFTQLEHKDHTETSLNIAPADYVLMDGSQQLNEEMIEAFIDRYSSKGYYFYYGPAYIINESTLRKKLTGLANSRYTIVNRIKEAILG